MYFRKKPEDLDCGIEVAAKVFSGKWKPCILDGINNGHRRPSELHRILPSATPRVINMQLRELEMHGAVYKKIFNEIPLRVEYYLTEMGKTILPIIAMMDVWGKTHAASIKRTVQMQQMGASVAV
jgi:DNA-binding HxlR family transcriptional regulator